MTGADEGVATSEAIRIWRGAALPHTASPRLPRKRHHAPEGSGPIDADYAIQGQFPTTVLVGACWPGDGPQTR